jgi:broad specificity phosphatase PhoE
VCIQGQSGWVWSLLVAVGAECGDDAIVAMTLLLIRHAQPAGHEHGYPQRLSGWHDVPLSATGRGEAVLLARRLQSEPPVDFIYSSPLQRAAETATTLAERLGLAVAHLPDLKEINCGEVEGQLLEQVQRTYQAHWEANLRQDDPDYRWPGGESYREFRARCLAGMAYIAAKHHEGRIAIVTHAGVISQLIGNICGMSPARWDAFRPGTASVTILEWRDGSGTLRAFDDRTHVQPDTLRVVMRREHQLG